MTREEYARIFGPENLHKYRPCPRTPTFILQDTINNKAQYALKTIPYVNPKLERLRSRARTKHKQPTQNNQNMPKDLLKKNVPEPQKENTLNIVGAFISLLKDLKDYVSKHSNNFSCILDIKSMEDYNKFSNVCDAVCFSVFKDYTSTLESVEKIKTKENLLLINAVVSEDFDTRTFNQTAYKADIVTNCSSDKDYKTLPVDLPYRLNNMTIDSLEKVNNFIIIKDYSNFNTKARFLLSAKNLQHDMLIIEPYYNKGHYFTPSDIEFMKYKKGNKLNKRLVYAYISMTYIHAESKFYKKEYMSEKEEINYWTDDWKQTFYASGDDSIINYLLKTGYDGIFISDVKE